ncbi:MAG: quinone-dependent dihydroorotate dehydrogenase [Elusimicrobia bacterium]|nr:quinone-dependent dihydroorotate dehydrogenase [Elusimicrobiota bacterium]
MLLEKLDAETVHHAVVRFLEVVQDYSWALSILRKRYCHACGEELRVRFGGLEFPNPVGLAAGWDKNIRVPLALSAMGFGFLELGSVTCWPETGHPRPRIFRSFKYQQIINRVGFANDGAVRAEERLRLRPAPASCPIGISLGKMLLSPSERLVPECAQMMEMFYPYAGFFSINVSSPNTPGGFAMSQADFLRTTLAELVRENRRLANRFSRPHKPLFVKIPPIIDGPGLNAAAQALYDSGVDGVIAVNSAATPLGGLSGLPLRSLALKTTAGLYCCLKDRLPIIGSGGIITADDAWQRVKAGAEIIELFSGFVFKGPGLVKEILKKFQKELNELGLKSIQEACGIDAQRYAR